MLFENTQDFIATLFLVLVFIICVVLSIKGFDILFEEKSNTDNKLEIKQMCMQQSQMAYANCVIELMSTKDE